jgi:uncharacterized SAM-binding protein YcdF (DUF218 family)
LIGTIRLLSRRRRRWTIVVIAVLGAVVIAGLPVYVNPQTDTVRRADAILILGGYEYDRYVTGFGLGDEGWAPNVVVSNPNGAKDAWLTEYCRAPHREFKLYCFLPEPGTTAGEAREFRRLADENGWRTVIVVTFRPHVSRARFIVQQCFDGAVIMVASPPAVTALRWVYEYARQTAGYVKAVLQPAC